MLKNTRRLPLTLMCLLVFFLMETHIVFAVSTPKVALVLGGGAARGFSHIGLIQAFEENGVPIDMLVGTSMGSVVSGLYAAGYSVENMKEIATQLNVASLIDILIPPKGGFINTARLEQYLDVLLHHKTFAELDTPFYSVITELATGEELALNQGKVSTGIQASMSIPALFPAVSINDVYYVDGGMKNAVPVNTASNFGADVIIGVDVKKELKSINYNSVLNNLQLAMWFMIDGYVELNTAEADVIIIPDVKFDSYMDYQKAEMFIEEGYLAGIKYMEQIKTAILAHDPDFEFVPYQQQGYSQECLEKIITKAEKTALNTKRPFSVTPQIQLSDDCALKLGLKLSHGPLSWFNLGYRYGFSAAEGGHEVFFGWSKPAVGQGELFVRKLNMNEKLNVGIKLEFPLIKNTRFQGSYQLNGTYKWRVSIVNNAVLKQKNFQLGSAAALVKKINADTEPIYLNLSGRIKLYLTDEFFSLMEITLARPYIYGQVDLESLLSKWEPNTSYQAGLGTNFRLFGMYPFDVNIGMIRNVDTTLNWKFSVFKEEF